MFSTDKNIETLAQLIEAVREYFSLQKDYLQVSAIEKTVRLISALLLFIILAFLFMLVVILLSFAAAFWLSANGMTTAGAFAAIALFYIFVVATIYIKREAWIQRPLIRVFAEILTK